MQEIKLIIAGRVGGGGIFQKWIEKSGAMIWLSKQTFTWPNSITEILEKVWG